MIKKEINFEIKRICQNFRLIGAIYCNNMGSNRKYCKMADLSPLFNSLYIIYSFSDKISECDFQLRAEDFCSHTDDKIRKAKLYRLLKNYCYGKESIDIDRLKLKALEGMIGTFCDWALDTPQMNTIFKFKDTLDLHDRERLIKNSSLEVSKDTKMLD